MEEETKKKVEDFAEAILNCPEYRDFIEADKALSESADSVSLLEKAEQKQRAFSMSGDDETLAELAEIQTAIREDQNIIRYEEAQQKILDVLAKTDELITQKIGTKFAQRTGGGGCCG